MGLRTFLARDFLLPPGLGFLGVFLLATLRAGFFRAFGRLAETRLTFFTAAFFFVALFLVVFFLAAFFLVAFFLVAFRTGRRVAARLAVCFLAAFFRVAFLADRLATAFFLVAFFLTAFLLVVFFLAVLRAGARFTDFFLAARFLGAAPFVAFLLGAFERFATFLAVFFLVALALPEVPRPFVVRLPVDLVLFLLVANDFSRPCEFSAVQPRGAGLPRLFPSAFGPDDRDSHRLDATGAPLDSGPYGPKRPIRGAKVCGIPTCRHPSGVLTLTGRGDGNARRAVTHTATTLHRRFPANGDIAASCCSPPR